MKHPNDTLSLFLGLFPDPFAASQTTALTNSLCAKHGLTGKRIAEHRYHVSLHPLLISGCSLEESARLAIAAAEKAAGPVPPFEVLFNRTVSFVGSNAYVLYSDGGNSLLRQFWEELGMDLRSVGMDCATKFNPHMTLLYEDRRIREEAVEPVSWIVNKFALILSHVGKTKYDYLGEWPLRG